MKLNVIGGSSLQGVDAAVQLDKTPDNLTRADSRMMDSPKGFPDALRGVVWSSSARTMKRPVNSGNGRDPHS